MLDDKIKATQVRLNGLVAGGSTIIEVPPETPVSLKVEQMNTVLVKIETKEHRGPLQL